VIMVVRRLLLPFLLMSSIAAMATENASITFESSAQRTALIELYTSEGCSSCPPAETWLSRLVDSPQLWRDFVPVAFHVDYWDYLGWRDPWGKEQFSARQRAYAASWRSRTVYTPEYVLNGQEWRDWARRDQVPKTSPAQIGVLRVTSINNDEWRISFTPTAVGKAGYEAHLVWLVSGESSDVKAGENHGRTLHHDFAALSFTEGLLSREGEAFEGSLHSSKPTKPASGRLALAIWVTKAGELESIQATGGWLSKSPAARKDGAK